MVKKKILLTVGARPNFMKMAPLYFELKENDLFTPIVVHTGQHYDYEMSQTFFDDLKIPNPHYFLGVGSNSHAKQTAKIMIEFEEVLIKEEPDLVVVFGDVNSTLACSLTTKKLNIPVAHIEAGLRSFDMLMPEEINRKLTDAISDMLFTPSRDGDENLVREGIESDKIYFVGNIMIDSLSTILQKIDTSYEDKILQKFGVQRKGYVLVTLHRPSNVDDKNKLQKILTFLNTISTKISVIFPMHPRTKDHINKFGINFNSNPDFRITAPLSYKEFIALEKNARLVLTDSGGIQEETTYLNIPCLTLRPNTERPITIKEGTNELVNLENIDNKVSLILSDNLKNGSIPELWDGKTAERIVKVLRGRN